MTRELVTETEHVTNTLWLGKTLHTYKGKRENRSELHTNLRWTKLPKQTVESNYDLPRKALAQLTRIRPVSDRMHDTRSTAFA